MINLQKKSLEHVIELLDSFDTHKAYSALIEAMTSNGIDNETRTKIYNKYQEALSLQTKKIIEAKSWVKTIVSDIKLT
jgi:hypothetical protein